MAQNPTDPLAGVPDVAPGPPSDPTQSIAEIWTNIFPWGDLNAKGVPERNLKLGPEILPVLAGIFIQSGSGPRMVQGDASGHLVASSVTPLTDRLTLPAAAGQPIIKITTPSLFPPGSWIMLAPAPGTGTNAANGPFQVGSWQADGLTLTQVLPIAYQSGDFIFAVPSFQPVGFDAIDRPVDVQKFVAGAAGAAASVVLPGVANRIVILAYLECETIQTGANAGGVAFRVWDGVSGGTQIWQQDTLLGTATNTVDRIPPIRRPMRSSPGNALTIDTTVPAAGQAVRISAGGWYDLEQPQGT